MTPQPLELVLFVAFALGVVTFAAARSLSMLAAINAVSLTCDPLLGQPSLVLFGQLGDVGASFFAISMYGISLQYLVYGPEVAYRATGPATLALVFAFGAIFFLENNSLLGAGMTARIYVAGARLIVFCLVLPLFVYLLQRRSVWPSGVRIPVVTILTLVTDSVLFFPCAFYNALPVSRLIDFMFVCIGIRAAVIVVSVPFLVLFLWLQRRGMVAGPGRRPALART